MSLPFDPQSLFDLADKIGFVKVIKNKLISRPDEAADKLVVVLGELSKIFITCDSELVRYLSLSFSGNSGLAEERNMLLTLEGGQISLRTSEARGHCHKIWNIYQNYLGKWFDKVLSPDEAGKMKHLFESLSYADSQMELAIHQLTGWLSAEAQITLDLIDDGKLQEANQHIRAARKEILPTRQAISQAMKDCWTCKLTSSQLQVLYKVVNLCW